MPARPSDMLRRAATVVLFLQLAVTAGSAAQDGTADERYALEAATALLKATFPDTGFDLVPEIRRLEARDLGSDVEARFAVPPREVPAGYVKVGFVRNPDSRTLDAGWALIHVARYATVAALSADLRRGEAVDATMLTPVYHDVTRNASTLLFDELVAQMDSIAFEAELNLAAGRILRDSDIRRSPDVRLGETLTMRITQRSFALEVEVVAREDASVGEEIRVYSRDLKTMYRARVVDASSATWSETL